MTDFYGARAEREKKFNRDIRRITYACVALVVIVGIALALDVWGDLAADRACEAKGGTAVAVMHGFTHEARCVKLEEVK